jgi:hypothetical protein
MKGINSDALPQREQSASPLKQGEVSSLLIKKRIGTEEAVAVMKGQEVQVQFEGKIPPGDRLTVVIGTVSEKGLLIVRPVVNQAAMKADVTDSLKTMMENAGFSMEANGDLLAAAKLTAARGGIVNEEVLTNLQYFLAEEPGTLSEKLKTIETMLEKKLELSVSQLHAVHQTLHGKNTAETLAQLMQSLGIQIDMDTPAALPEKELQAISQALEGKGDLQSAVEKWLAEFLIEKNNSTPLFQIDQASAAEAVYTQQAWQSKNIIVTEITKRLAGLAADFKKAQRSISLNLEQIVNSTNSKQTPVAAKETLEHTIHKLNQVMLKSDIMLYADMETEKQLLKAGSRLTEAGRLIEKGNLAEAKAIVQEIKGLIDNLHFKPANVKVMHFTEDLLQQNLTQESALKQTIKTQIEQTLKPHAIQQHSARQILESIKALGMTHELDAANTLLQPKQEAQIKRSPTMLQEQQTKQQSAQYQEWQGNLKTVQYRELHVHDKAVKQQDLQVHDKAAKQQDLQTNLKPIPHQEPQTNLKGAQYQEQQIHDAISRPQNPLFKQMLSHQHEPLSILRTSLQQNLESSSDPQSNQNAIQPFEQQPNLKEALLKLLQSESSHTSPMHEAEQTIAHITGQQLLNKTEPSGMQQLYLQLPLLLNNNMENIKVYISSEKKNETLDWENCSLYFVLDTKKMGEVGIMVHVQNRQLSLTFKNNRELFQKKMEPLAGETLERLQEIGYNTGAIQYESFPHNTMENEEQPKNARSETRKAPAVEKKGFDFSI